MAAYRPVEPVARVRFPLTALNIFRCLCKLLVKVLRTVRLADKSLLAVYNSRPTFRRWNSKCPEGPNKGLAKQTTKTFINANAEDY
jgi:hypothetical protein